MRKLLVQQVAQLGLDAERGASLTEPFWDTYPLVLVHWCVVLCLIPVSYRGGLLASLHVSLFILILYLSTHSGTPRCGRALRGRSRDREFCRGRLAFFCNLFSVYWVSLLD